MKKLRIVLVCLLTGLLIGAFAGCHPDEPEVPTYTFTFVSNGGTEIEPLVLKEGDAVTRPKDPVKTDYIFGGWWESSSFTGSEYVFGTMPAHDVTVYAKWNETPRYDVVFDTRGGTAVQGYRLKVGETIGEPSAKPTRSWSTFTGWYADEDCTQKYTFGGAMPEHDVTVYAGWTWADNAKFVRVSFDARGGSEVAALVGRTGDAFTAPAAPERNGYTFGGWYTDETCTQRFTATAFPESDVLLYAKWEKRSDVAIVSFYGNGVLIEEKVFANGSSITAPTAEDLFDAEDMIELTGWYTDAALKSQYSPATASGQTLSLYTAYYTKGIVIENGTVVRYGGTSNKVSVPSVYNGVSVTKIGDRAFRECKTVTEIKLPAGIVSVGKEAFYNCYELKSVDLPASVSEIGAFAFFNCMKMQTYGDISSVREIPEGLFLGCDELLAVELGSGVRSVGKQAFADCGMLRSVVLPDAITTIPDGLFDGCTLLETVKLPASMSDFGKHVFDGCSSLKKIELASNNAFSVKDNNLYRGNVLLRYIQGGKTETSFSVTGGEIAEGAFENNVNIETLTVGSGVTLGCGSLRGLKALTTLSVPTIGEDGYLAWLFGATAHETAGSVSKYIPLTLHKLTITGTYSEAKDYAFYGASGLGEIEGLGNLTQIGEYAFAYTGLASFRLTTDNFKANSFVGCSGLQEFTLGSGSVYTVSDGALYDGATLVLVPGGKTSIAFKSGTTSIRENAFAGGMIESVTVPGTVTRIGLGAFADCNRLSALSVPFIGGGASNNAYLHYIFGATLTATSSNITVNGEAKIPSSLKSVTVTKSISAVPSYAFYGLTALRSVKFTGPVSSIGEWAFANSGVKTIDLNGVTTIGGYAFFGSDLTEVHIPSTLRTAGEMCFGMLMDLETITMEEGLEEIPEAMFYAVAYSDVDMTTSAVDMEVVIPASVRTIGQFAFSGMGVTGDYYSDVGVMMSRNQNFSIRIAEGSRLTTVGVAAFEGSGIVTLELPATVTTLGQQAFNGCNYLESVTFGNAEEGSSLNSIGVWAFSTASLRTLTFYGTTVPRLTVSGGNHPFTGVNPALVIRVPEANLRAYQRAWSSYTGSATYQAI